MSKTTLRIPTRRRKTQRHKKSQHFQGLSHQVAFKDKKKSAAQKQWIARQKNDPYVQRAAQEGWRCRSAYKLLEINEQLHIISPHTHAIDLGAAPGGWSQVLLRKRAALVIGIDLLPIAPQRGAHFIQGDFRSPEIQEEAQHLCGTQNNLVVSDMAPNTTGHHRTDHLRILALAEEALDFACQTLTKGGHFVTKLFQGGTEDKLLKKIRAHFKTLRIVKPAASRKESSEIFIVGLHYAVDQ